MIRPLPYPNINELIDFIESNPSENSYSKQLVQRFLTEFISDLSLVFDLHDNSGRAGVAVLLDKINNIANDSSLEILGRRAGLDKLDLTKQMISLALKSNPKRRSGIQFGLNEDELLEAELIRIGFRHYYDTFDMMNSDVENTKTSALSQIIEATVHDSVQIYKLLCESFAKNPDTSIPDFDVWRNNFESSSSKYYVWKDDVGIRGFANLILMDEQNSSEIRTVGVHPDCREQGIGQGLIEYCLQRTLSSGLKNCNLTVSASNERALSIYLRSGFRVIGKTKCYRIDT